MSCGCVKTKFLSLIASRFLFQLLVVYVLLSLLAVGFACCAFYCAHTYRSRRKSSRRCLGLFRRAGQSSRDMVVRSRRPGRWVQARETMPLTSVTVVDNPHYNCLLAPSPTSCKLKTWASYQIRRIAGCACTRECREPFPRHRWLAIPTYITAHASRTCRDACWDR